MPMILPIALLAVLLLGFFKARLWMWTVAAFLVAAFVHASIAAWIGLVVAACLFNVVWLRRQILSRWIMILFQRLHLMPKISDTERIALEAGDVWIERDLFSGRPSIAALMGIDYPTLSEEEQKFLHGPTEKLCSMMREWNLWRDRDFTPELWSFLKRERFWGMIIPKEFGGLGFSAAAHSAVIQKVSSRSLSLGVTVMVPNSLGPAELLTLYGTDEQKKYYLPRLARGEEIPCFALTEPHAGSDASSIVSHGEVFRGDDGKLFIRLNWNKRWITLAPIATVMGLAFRLHDPDHLLGDRDDLGITLALVPMKNEGVVHSRRHDPLTMPFPNGPTQGKDVVVPLDAVIGGHERIGQGWKMIVESLGAGRGISLPALTSGLVKYEGHVVGAHSVVRQQFGTSIANFGGVVEALAPISGYCYLFEAARRVTCGAIDRGHKPSVITAIMKYFTTELSRDSVVHAMDIFGGAGITLGPKNVIADRYFSAPIQVTVEGANILTRSLIIFGQGALRAHPYAYDLIKGLEARDLAAFDKSFWSLLGNFFLNGVRAFVLSLTRGHVVYPLSTAPAAKFRRKLLWSSASFAFLSDFLMFVYGGKLRTNERITGRMADILGWMYLATSAMKRFEVEGRRVDDRAHIDWCLARSFHEIQRAFDGVFANIEAPLLGPLVRGPLRWYSALNAINQAPSDHSDEKITQAIVKPSALRDRLLEGIYFSKDPEEREFELDKALDLTWRSEPAQAKLRAAVKEKKLAKNADLNVTLKRAVELQILSSDEARLLDEADAARDVAIQVDDFAFADFFSWNVSQPKKGNPSDLPL